MSDQQAQSSGGLNRAKPYQLALFPMNNGATNVYYVLILTYIATFGNTVLGIATVFASFMVTGMRVFDAITDPIIGALMDRMAFVWNSTWPPSGRISSRLVTTTDKPSWDVTLDV